MHQGAEKNKQRAVKRAEEVEQLRAKGLTYSEIAETLECSADVVRQIVSRNKKRNQQVKPPVKFYVKSVHA